jgi:hypothetical protein
MTIDYQMDLTQLSKNFSTDKSTHHSYTKHYDFHFSSLRNKPLKLLEIGVGGYSNFEEGGGSLKMWKEYFSQSNIYSFDIVDKTHLSEERIQIYHGDQSDNNFLQSLIDSVGTLDIIIDDGSHYNSHVLSTFEFLFPKLNNGGIYVVEDTQTSYWKSMGGDSIHSQNSNTIMNFFKSLSDGLNYREYISPGYQPTYYDQNINSIHFYHNLIFVHKDENIEESNIIQNNCGNSWAY